MDFERDARTRGDSDALRARFHQCDCISVQLWQCMTRLHRFAVELAF
jgi:hypothetical protein